MISPDNILLQNDCHMHCMLLPITYLHAEFEIAVYSQLKILDLDPVLTVLPVRTDIYSGLHQQSACLIDREKPAGVNLVEVKV